VVLSGERPRALWALLFLFSQAPVQAPDSPPVECYATGDMAALPGMDEYCNEVCDYGISDCPDTVPFCSCEPQECITINPSYPPNFCADICPTMPHFCSESVCSCPSTTTTTTQAPDVAGHTQCSKGGYCKAIGPYEGLAGFDTWCCNNCKHVPPFCPPSICHCV